MRWEVQEGAILENNSVDVTVRIPSDNPDGTRDAKRLERTERAGPFRRGWLNLTYRTPGGRIRYHMAFEQFLCFEMAVCADALLRLNHLYEFPRQMRRELDHSAVGKQQTVNFAPWIKEILRNRAFYLRWERPLVGPVRPDPEFVFHFCTLFLVRPILRPSIRIHRFHTTARR
jgi:hypothetical protein